MKNYMKLPINSKHNVLSSIMKAGIYSILTSEEYTGKLNASVSDFCLLTKDEQYNFISGLEHSTQLHNMTTEVVKDELMLLSEPCDEAFGLLYKEISIQKGEEYILRATLNYQQDSHANSYLKLLFANGVRRYEQKTHELCFGGECSIVITPRGRMCFHHGPIYKKCQLPYTNGKQRVHFKLIINKMITAEYSLDNKNWEVIWQMKSDMHGIKKAGIYVNPKINPFFYQFCITQLQLCYSRTTKTMMSQTEMSAKNFTNLLEIYTIPKETLMDSKEQLVNYFINLIELRYYICLRLDEYYVPERYAYQSKHFFHSNFIYGFDKKKEIFLLLGFEKYIKLTEIGFEEFIKALQYDKAHTDKITIYKYNSKKYPEKFPINIAIRILKAYLEGECCYAVAGDKIVSHPLDQTMLYGLNVYKAIINQDDDMEAFITDIRLSNQLYEHYQNLYIMLGNLGQLHCETEELCRCMNGVQELLTISESIKVQDLKLKLEEIMLVMIKKDEHTTQDVIKYLQSL